MGMAGWGIFWNPIKKAYERRLLTPEEANKRREEIITNKKTDQTTEQKSKETTEAQNNTNTEPKKQATNGDVMKLLEMNAVYSNIKINKTE